MKEKISGAVFYLAGPLDDPKLDVEKDCKQWRNKLKELLKENNIKITCLDPTQKLSSLTNQIEDDHKQLIQLQKDGNFIELRKRMKVIVKQDLRVVDLSDALVVMIDPDVHLCGTYNELINAVNQKKPIFIYCPKGKVRMPRWVFGLVHYDQYFQTLEDLVNYLSKLNNGTIELNDKWVLIRKELHNLTKENI